MVTKKQISERLKFLNKILNNEIKCSGAIQFAPQFTYLTNLTAQINELVKLYKNLETFKEIIK